MRWLAVAAAMLVPLAGCLADDEAEKVSVDDGASPLEVAPSLQQTWSATCPCPPVSLIVPATLDQGFWLEVRVRWDGTAIHNMGMNLTLTNGSVVAGERGFDARRVQVWGAEAGTYLVQVAGEGSYEADARIRSLEPADGAQWLPNLVTTVPVDIHVGGCDVVETLEQGATRCLRLGNGVGNAGHGPLQVYLTYPEGAMALGGMGHFVQQVLQADGTMKEHTVSGATFHATHSHWHYDGLAQFALYAVDPDSRLRLQEVSAHKKAGFCFLDWDILVETESVEGAGGFAESDCLVPFTNGWSNGVSAGWYDFYESGLTDQYVDIARLTDGVYEYVSVADPLNSLEEADPLDNAASVVIKLAGDAVTVLEKRGWYHVQAVDDPDAGPPNVP